MICDWIVRMVSCARRGRGVASKAGRRYNCQSGSRIDYLKKIDKPDRRVRLLVVAQARGSGTNEENAVVISASAISGSCESCPGKPSGFKCERDRYLSPVYYWQ
jgi:hypothetical protein